MTDAIRRRFEHGSTWVRADFHLHTAADKEFERPAAGLSFKKAYVQRLLQEDVGLGVITNHNKFDRGEFRSLRKAANKHGIYLLPGIELSVADGVSGVHVLIVFEPESWVDSKSDRDYINLLLDNAFPHAANREHENFRCQWNLRETLQKLMEHEDRGRHSFIVMAHVDQAKGCNTELGLRMKDYFDDNFRRFVLGFQKVRSRDNLQNLAQWLGSDWKPARLEGSDCKSLDQVGHAHKDAGKKKRTFLKLGAFSFQAVRLALLMKEQRVAETRPERGARFVRRISFTGGLLHGRTLTFSPDMTDLIGIRGSGKSSILECLRYVLDCRLTADAEDANYKEALVGRTLGSGGKASVDLVTEDGTSYQMQRIFKDSPKVFRGSEVIPNLRPLSVLKTRYFGQRDLAKFSEQRSAWALVERFTGGAGAKADVIEALRHRIEQRLVMLNQGEQRLSKIDEVKGQLAEIREDLEKFEAQGLGERLKAQIALEKDLDYAGDVLTAEADALKVLQDWIESYEAPLESALTYRPAGDTERYAAIQGSLERYLVAFRKIKGIAQELENERNQTENGRNALKAFYDSQKEAFAEVRRNLHLKDELSADSFLQLSKRKGNREAILWELETLRVKRMQLEKELQRDLATLQDLWHEEHQERLQEIERLNTASADLRIELQFKADKEAFVEKLSGVTTGLQRRTLRRVCDEVADGVELYLDLVRDREAIRNAGLKEDQILKLKECVFSNLENVLSYRPPDRTEIFYKNNPLQSHSLGQRATALMLFLLAQGDFDLLIVDQPEDDLDNQTIFEEVIKRLLSLKGKRQIIFATHSPNILVLGDAEQVLRCRFTPDRIDLLAGTIDDRKMQSEIVSVMEGGEDAFLRRQQIYESWTP